MGNLISTSSPSETLPQIRVQTHSIRCSTVPTATENIILVDTTRGKDGLTPSASTPDASALFAPGTFQNAFNEFGIEGTIRVGNQDVTLYYEALTGVAGTLSDWEVESGGSTTILAGTTLPFWWDPQGNDFRLRLKAGATAPNSLVVRIRLCARTE